MIVSPKGVFYYSNFSFSSFTMLTIQTKIPIKTSKSHHLTHIFSTSILKAQLSANADNSKINSKSQLIGRLHQVHSVMDPSKILMNPPMVIIGTSGTINKLIKIPVKFVLPIKNNKIGSVPKLAHTVGKKYSLTSLLSIAPQEPSSPECLLNPYRSEILTIPINAPKLSKKPKS